MFKYCFEPEVPVQPSWVRPRLERLHSRTPKSPPIQLQKMSLAVRVRFTRAKIDSLMQASGDSHKVVVTEGLDKLEQTHEIILQKNFVELFVGLLF